MFLWMDRVRKEKYGIDATKLIKIKSNLFIISMRKTNAGWVWAQWAQLHRSSNKLSLIELKAHNYYGCFFQRSLFIKWQLSLLLLAPWKFWRSKLFCLIISLDWLWLCEKFEMSHICRAETVFLHSLHVTHQTSGLIRLITIRDQMSEWIQWIYRHNSAN